MELPFVKDMFDAIAHRYDFLNRLLSLRQDVRWRREMIRALSLGPESRILDAACGTGDVMVELLQQMGTGGMVIGIDFSPEMLKIARAKLRTCSKSALVAGNALRLPFAPCSFDALTIAFGIRNIMDRPGALSEFYRMLKPGGTLAVLELATPQSQILMSLYLFYFTRVLPKIGALLSSHSKAYQYLPASVIHFPKPPEFAGLMRKAGFGRIRYKPLSLGIATLYIGIKPSILSLPTGPGALTRKGSHRAHS